MKTVFPSREIPHMWAHDTQSEARNPQSNLFFRDQTIFSYVSSFPIARFVAGPEHRCVFFTNRSSSVTTAKHKSMVRRAIPGAFQVFEVGDVRGTAADALKYYQETVEFWLIELKLADKRKQPGVYKRVLEVVAKAKEFCEFFQYSTKFCELPADLSGMLGLAKGLAQKLNRRERDAKRRKEKRERLAREKFEREVLPTIVADWRGGEPWDYRFNRSNVPTMLRIDGRGIESVVETTMGASFPVEHALRVMPLIEKLLNEGKTYQKNGHTIHLGQYSLDSIDENGTVTAGCHIVAKDEVLRLIGELKNLDPLFLTPMLPVEES